MKKFAPLLVAPVLLAGCASIFNGSSKPVAIKSTPDGADFTIANRAGQVIHSGKTPSTVTLKGGAGYFKGEQYKVNLKKPGYDDTTADIKTGLSGWYFGNILLGGLLGMLIVDPLTGGMYTLPAQTEIPMRKLPEAETTAAAGASPDSAAAPAGAKEMGRDQLQAEKLAASMSCTNTTLSGKAPGSESYTITCNGAEVALKCEFGNCAKVN